MTTPALETALHFVACINAREAEGIAALMTPEHRFIDSLGGEFRGRETMRQAWEPYFHMVPDYFIEVRSSFSEGDDVALFGTAGGTFRPGGKADAGGIWRTQAAWKATIENGCIAVWQVFADNEPMRLLMASEHAVPERKASGEEGKHH